MKALSTVLLLAGCGVENQVNDIPEYDIDSEIQVPETPTPEQPRIYFFDVPSAPAVADDGTVLMVDWRTGGDVYLWNEATGLEWVTTTGAYFNSVWDIPPTARPSSAPPATTWRERMRRRPSGPHRTAGPSSARCPAPAAAPARAPDTAFPTTAPWSRGWVGSAAPRTPSSGPPRPAWSPRSSCAAAATGRPRSPATAACRSVSRAAVVPRPPGMPTARARWSTSKAYAICGAPDELILGNDSIYGGVATAWTEETGLVSLVEFFNSKGWDLPPTTRLTNAIACTPDKRVLVGTGGDNDEEGVWVAVLPFGFLDQ